MTPDLQTETQSRGCVQRLVRRSQRLHTAISLLESVCVTLERVTTDGVVELHPKVSRWCKQIRDEQQELVKEFDKCNSEIHTPND